MTRRGRHRTDDILDAAQTLVLERGVQHATVDAIARHSGAPVGSLYHRFGSRDQLVAELWVRAVRRSQGAFLVAASHPDPERAAVNAALSIYDFVRQHPDDARLLVSFRREDLLSGQRSRRLLRELEELNRPLQEAVTTLARRLYRRAASETIEHTILAVIDLPMGVVRRHLLAGKEPPAWLRGELEAVVLTVLRNRRKSA